LKEKNFAYYYYGRRITSEEGEEGDLPDYILKHLEYIYGYKDDKLR